MAEAPKKKKSYPIQVTPVAIASWPKLHKPDDKYNKFQCGLRFTVEEGKKFLAQFEEMDKANLAEAQEKMKGHRNPKTLELDERVDHQGLPFKMELDKTTKQPTGYMTIPFNANASWKDKDKKEQPTRLILQDSKKNPLAANVTVTGGSKVRVAFVPNPYFIEGTRACGISFRLVGVQVIELAANYQDPFAVEEGGFESSTNSEAPTNSGGSSAVSAQGAGDF